MTTLHCAIGIYDHYLHIDNILEQMRRTYDSCKDVISEQLCTFIASLSLFISAKYNEIKYPIVGDICLLMKCPFEFNEFVEMESVILRVFEWNLELPNVLVTMEIMLSQGVVFEDDEIIIPEPDLKSVSITKLIDLDEDVREHTVRKVRKLCEYLPNLVIYEPSLVIDGNPIFLTVALILEARRKCQLTPIWPD